MPSDQQVARPRVPLAACPQGTRGTFPKQGSRDSCQPCDEEFYSLPGSTACSLCNGGYFAQPAVSTHPSRSVTDDHRLSCAECSSGMICEGAGLTLRTVRLEQDHWRLSTRSRSVYRCLLGTNGASSCKGGKAIGDESSDYCQPGHTGPLCQVCVQSFNSSDGLGEDEGETEGEGEEEGESEDEEGTEGQAATTAGESESERASPPPSGHNVTEEGGRRYFDKDLGTCTSCPLPSQTLGVVAAILLAPTGAVASLWLLLHLQVTRRTLRYALHRLRRLIARAHNLHFVALLKLLVVSYHMFSAIHDVYGVVLPPHIAAIFQLFFMWFRLDWLEVVLPGECLVGGFYQHLTLYSVIPLGAFVLLVALSTLHELVAATTTTRRTGTAGGVVPSRRFPLQLLRRALTKALPLVLFVANFLVAPVSSFSFAAWRCHPYVQDDYVTPVRIVEYLALDYRVVCGSPEHANVISVARANVAIWWVQAQPRTSTRSWAHALFQPPRRPPSHRPLHLARLAVKSHLFQSLTVPLCGLCVAGRFFGRVSSSYCC